MDPLGFRWFDSDEPKNIKITNVSETSLKYLYHKNYITRSFDTTRKRESNDNHLRLQMCSRKLTSTLCLTYDYVKVCRNLDVILLLNGLVVNWS